MFPIGKIYREDKKSRSLEADKVEVRFRGSKWDQGRKGAVLEMMRNDRARERESGEGGVVQLLGEPFGMFSGG